MTEHTRDPFRLIRKPLKKYVEPNRKAKFWLQPVKCQSINISLIDCKDMATIELHAPSPDRDGAWLILYLCKTCLNRYSTVERNGKKRHLVEHRLTNEVLVYKAIDLELGEEIPF